MADFFAGLFKFTGELLVIMVILFLVGMFDPMLISMLFTIFVVALVLSAFD